MKSLLFLLAFTLSTSLFAQESWKISHNGKQRLQTSIENEAQNVISIKRNALKKKGQLWIYRVVPEEQKGWNKTITLVDSKDTELAQSTSNSYKVTNAKLTALFKKASTIKVYYSAVPSDPELASRIRVRRVHLCTIRLEP